MISASKVLASLTETRYSKPTSLEKTAAFLWCSVTYSAEIVKLLPFHTVWNSWSKFLWEVFHEDINAIDKENKIQLWLDLAEKMNLFVEE